MPAFLEENFEYIVSIAFIALIIIMILLLRYSVYMSKFFSNKKFRVYSKYTFEPSDKTKQFTFNIFNNNVNDTRIIAFGYIYKNHNIDYFKTYLEENKLPSDSKVIIQSRDCILTSIDALNLKTIITDMNRGNRKVKKIQSFVSDSQGLTFKSNAGMVKRQLAYFLKEDYEKSQEEQRDLRKQHKQELKEIRHKKHIDNQLKRKEKLNKITLKFKSLWPFKKKK